MLTPEFQKFLDAAKKVHAESGSEGFVEVPQHIVDEFNDSVKDKLEAGLREVRRNLAYSAEQSKSIIFTS